MVYTFARSVDRDGTLQIEDAYCEPESGDDRSWTEAVPVSDHARRVATHARPSIINDGCSNRTRRAAPESGVTDSPLWAIKSARRSAEDRASKQRRHTRWRRERASSSATAAVLTVAYLLLPASRFAELIRIIGPAIGVAAVVLGILTYQPRRTLAWSLLAGSLGMLVIAQLIWALRYFGGSDTFPTAGDALHLVSAAVLVIALGMLGQEESPDDDSLGSIETAIVGVAVGLGVWLAVVEPYLADRGLAFGDRVWAVLVPMLGALAVAIAFRTAAQTRFRVPSTVLLAVGVSLLLVSDVTRSIAELRGTLVAGGVIAALSIAPPLLIGAAALDPTMTHRGRPAITAPMLGFGRVVWLSVAALTPLTVLLTLSVTGLGTRATQVDLGGLRRDRGRAGADADVAAWSPRYAP